MVLFDIPTLVACAVVALLIVAWGPRQARAFVIMVAQYAMFLVLLLITAVAGRFGYVTGTAIGQSYNFSETGQLYYAIAGAAVGGVSGFVAGALVCSVFFVLLEIRQNTRG